MPNHKTASDYGKRIALIEYEILAICKEMKTLVSQFKETFPSVVGQGGWALLDIKSAKSQRGRFEPTDIHWREYYYYTVQEVVHGEVRAVWRKAWKKIQSAEAARRFPRTLAQKQPELAEIFYQFHIAARDLVNRRTELVAKWESLRKQIQGLASDLATAKNERIIKQARALKVLAARWQEKHSHKAKGTNKPKTQSAAREFDRVWGKTAGGGEDDT